MIATARSRAEQEAITVLPPRPAPTPADEAHHRIANSLQLVSAMISLEARGVADPAGLAALDVTRRRIAAIAGLHRLLYQTQGPGSVDLAAYLEQLGDRFAEAAGREVIVDAIPLSVGAEEAGTIGIIVSELVTNAWKHAYAAEAPGGVRIVLRRRAASGYRLEVVDRGRGLVRGSWGTGLGTELVRTLAARLGGVCSYRPARPGTRFVLDVEAR